MKELRFEDATPRPVTVEGYACHGCGRVHAGEDQARSCCATSYPCECGGRKPKHYTMCDNCRWTREHDAWLASACVAWDCEFPVGEYDNDEFHWDADSLVTAILDDVFADAELLTLQMVVNFCDTRRVCKCERVPRREFCVDDFLCDHLPDDCDIPREQADRIDAAVNAILAAEKLPELWTHVKQRIDPRAIAEALGVEARKGGE